MPRGGEGRHSGLMKEADSMMRRLTSDGKEKPPSSMGAPYGIGYF
jgi:hypothetical protein